MYVILGFGARERRLVYVRFLRVGGRRLLRCECHCEYMCVLIFVKSPIIFHSVNDGTLDKYENAHVLTVTFASQ